MAADRSTRLGLWTRRRPIWRCRPSPPYLQRYAGKDAPLHAIVAVGRLGRSVLLCCRANILLDPRDLDAPGASRRAGSKRTEHGSYNNFPSKEALTVAIYEDMAAATLRALDVVLSGLDSGRERIVAIFDLFSRNMGSAGYRGCPFIHVSFQEAEVAGWAYLVGRSYKRSLREAVLASLDPGRADAPNGPTRSCCCSMAR